MDVVGRVELNGDWRGKVTNGFFAILGHRRVGAQSKVCEHVICEFGAMYVLASRQHPRMPTGRAKRANRVA